MCLTIFYLYIFGGVNIRHLLNSRILYSALGLEHFSGVQDTCRKLSPAVVVTVTGLWSL